MADLLSEPSGFPKSSLLPRCRRCCWHWQAVSPSSCFTDSDSETAAMESGLVWDPCTAASSSAFLLQLCPSGCSRPIQLCRAFGDSQCGRGIKTQAWKLGWGVGLIQSLQKSALLCGETERDGDLESKQNLTALQFWSIWIFIPCCITGMWKYSMILGWKVLWNYKVLQRRCHSLTDKQVDAIKENKALDVYVNEVEELTEPCSVTWWCDSSPHGEFVLLCNIWSLFLVAKPTRHNAMPKLFWEKYVLQFKFWGCLFVC